jgi:hypothetical protein
MYFFFNKFLKESYNYYGLILTPSYNHKDDSVVWDVDNPENKSYSIETITNLPHELFYDFTNLTGQNEFYKTNWGRACRFNKPNNYYYLNPLDEKELNDRLKQITKIDFKDFYSEVVCTYIQIWPDEDFRVQIGMKLINPINKETNESLSGEKLKNELIGLNEDDNFFNDYDYDLFLPVLNFIQVNPLLYDNEYMFFSNSIDWITSDNKIIDLYH